jgi:type IX secretion system PorP/SprF family membrane protein
MPFLIKSCLKGLLLTFLILSSIVCLYAQDPQYSQYYASPLYLNPAFAGAEFLPRVGVNYRNQWPSLQTQFSTFSASYDQFIEDYNSSIGFLVMNDTEGAARLQSTTIALIYNYELRLGEKSFFRPGIRTGYLRREIGFYENLIFANNINPQDPYGDLIPGSDLPGFGNTKNLISLSAGGLFYTEKLWLGLAVDHLNQPNQSFINGISLLPRKYSFHSGYRIPIRSTTYRKDFTHTFKERYLLPTVHFKKQGPFEQLDLGAYYFAEPYMLGVWYRGLPYQTINNQSNRDAIVIMLGLNLITGLNVGYSFDFTLSALGIQSGGAHEISLSILLKDRNRSNAKDRFSAMPSPKF